MSFFLIHINFDLAKYRYAIRQTIKYNFKRSAYQFIEPKADIFKSNKI